MPYHLATPYCITCYCHVLKTEITAARFYRRLQLYAILNTMSKEAPPEVKTGKSKGSHWGWLTALILLVLIIYVFGVYVLPLPSITPQAESVKLPSQTSSAIAWPAYGQSAIGSPGYGVLDNHGEQKPVPTASVAKVLTALAVLKQKPLQKNQQGTAIIVTDDDLLTYQKYSIQGGSVVEVKSGEQLTEYQALQALLLPSANNIADMLANWAFGSQQAYVQFANSFVKSLGLTATTVDDASGFSAKTVSNARDLVLLGENVMDNPVLAEIVGQTQATIPVAGTIQNVNLLVGNQEVIGIKTGNTDEAGGCFMVAAKHAVDSTHSIIVIAVIMGAPDLHTSIASTLPLLQSSYANFSVSTIVPSGQKVGSYQTSWGKAVAVQTTGEIKGVVWKSALPKVHIDLKTVSLSANKTATPDGEVWVLFGRKKVSSPIKGAAIEKPAFLWRLTHPVT